MTGTAELTWSRPPPSALASPSLTRLGRWERWLLKGGGPVGRTVTAVMESSPTAMPWSTRCRGTTSSALFAKARELEAQGVDRDEILKWFRGEGVAHAKTKAKSDSDAQAKTQACRRSGTVRVTQTRIRYYKLDKHLTDDKKKGEVFIKKFCHQS